MVLQKSKYVYSIQFMSFVYFYASNHYPVASNETVRASFPLEEVGTPMFTW